MSRESSVVECRPERLTTRHRLTTRRLPTHGRLPPALALLADDDPDRRPLPRSSSPRSSSRRLRAPSVDDLVPLRPLRRRLRPLASSTGPSAASCRRGPRRTSRSSATSAWSALLVYSSGGPNSVFTFLYLVVIGAAAFLLYRTGAVVIASVAALLHGLMVELTAYEVLPRPPLAPAPHWGAERDRLQPRDHGRRLLRRGLHGVLPLREAARRPRGARAAPEGALRASRPSTPTSSRRCPRAW